MLGTHDELMSLAATLPTESASYVRTIAKDVVVSIELAAEKPTGPAEIRASLDLCAALAKMADKVDQLGGRTDLTPGQRRGCVTAAGSLRRLAATVSSVDG